MLLIDANVFMYAGGSEHPIRSRRSGSSGKWLREGRKRLLKPEYYRRSSTAIGRWAEGRAVYDLARTIVPLVIPVTDSIMDLARRLMDRQPRIMAGDAVHASAVLEVGAEAICTFDEDFDRIPEIQRPDPSSFPIPGGA